MSVWENSSEGDLAKCEAIVFISEVGFERCPQTHTRANLACPFSSIRNLTTMETISQMLQSPAWWISTVLVALIINLMSSYFWSRLIDKWLNSWSEKRRKKSEELRKRSKEEQERYFKDVASLSKDPITLIMHFIGAVTVIIIGAILMLTTLSTGILLATSTQSLNIRIQAMLGAIGFMSLGVGIVRTGNRKLIMCIEANELRKKTLLKKEEKEEEPEELRDKSSNQNASDKQLEQALPGTETDKEGKGAAATTHDG